MLSEAKNFEVNQEIKFLKTRIKRFILMQDSQLMLEPSLIFSSFCYNRVHWKFLDDDRMFHSGYFQIFFIMR